MARGLAGTQWITQEMPKHCLEPTQILRSHAKGSRRQRGGSKGIYLRGSSLGSPTAPHLHGHRPPPRAANPHPMTMSRSSGPTGSPAGPPAHGGHTGRPSLEKLRPAASLLVLRR